MLSLIESMGIGGLWMTLVLAGLSLGEPLCSFSTASFDRECGIRLRRCGGGLASKMHSKPLLTQFEQGEDLSHLIFLDVHRLHEYVFTRLSLFASVPAEADCSGFPRVDIATPFQYSCLNKDELLNEDELGDVARTYINSRVRDFARDYTLS